MDVTQSTIKICGVLEQVYHMPVKKCTQTSAFHEPTTKKSNIQKQMLHNKYLHLRSKINWETYRQQRNFVNKLR
jgi:hypothetical protein